MTFASRRTRPLKSGAAMVTALIFTLVTSSLVAGALLLAQSQNTLAYSNVRSESALLLAEAGVNDEIQYISTNLGVTDITLLSTQPVVKAGETATFPGEGSPLKGRKGSVVGQSDKYFWVYSSLDEAGTTGWDGRTAQFWIHSTAVVDGSWRRVRVKVQAVSIFTLHAIFALAAYENASNAITLASATVSVIGTGGTNGTLINNNSTIVVSEGLNCNTGEITSGQFLQENVATGGGIVTRVDPLIYPSVSTVLKRVKGRTGDTDEQIWAYLAANNNNATGVYTYRGNAASTDINTSNCELIGLSGNVFVNKSGSTLGAWQNAGPRPGSYLNSTGVTISGASNTTPIEITTGSNHGLETGQHVQIVGVGGNTAANGAWKITKTGPKKFTLNSSVGSGTYTSGGTSYQNEVKTLIFQPGDYYFTNLDLIYDYRTKIVIDPQAYASGGTPGQIRFWLYDPANGTQNDFFQLPISVTLPAGGTAPDPSLFRLYYAKDGKTFQFARPSSVSYINETSHVLEQLTGDFTVFGGVYAVTKLPYDASALKGTTIDFTGTTGGSGGTIKLIGSLLADKISFHGPCVVQFQESENTNDPIAGVGVIGGYNDGGRP